MPLHTKPRIRRTAQNTQLTYNFSQRVTDLQTYPVQSPQGATILIYGHDNGVTLAWRGGRRFKESKSAAQGEKQNGANNDVLVIDSDDGDSQPPPKAQQTPSFVDKPEFEDAVQDGPYPEIVQTLDLMLGTAVLHVAVMPVTPCPASEAGSSGAAILSERIVFAVSCVTKDVYVISLPLTPPSPESKARTELTSDLLAGKAGSGAWGESVVLLGGQSQHSEGLAMSFASPTGSKPSRVVVAAHSREAGGILRLWETSLDEEATSGRPIEPFQTEFLPSPLTRVSFNPTHATQVLAVSSRHGVRIYDYALASLPPDPEATGPFPTQGSWLLTLYQPFLRPSSTRKHILDAAWILHGHAVFALLADGMWGIWDIDGVGPSTSGASMSTKLRSGVRGGALTVFGVHGYVEGTSSLRSAAHQKEGQSSDFVPMTPHTRRQAAASLSLTASVDRLATVHGGVTVMALPSRGKALQDESVGFWIGGLEHVCVIPGVSRFWESQLRKGAGGGVNLFSGAQPTRMVKLLDLSTGLLGERCCGIGLAVDQLKHANSDSQDGGLPVEVLIQGDRRVVVVREAEDGPGRKIGGVINARRRGYFSREDRADAIIVHGKQGKTPSMSFNLSTAQPGSLRRLPSQRERGARRGDASTARDTLQQMPTRSRSGLDFTNMMSAAADVTDDFSRDVEAEVLDIMEIDQALSSMEESRGPGRKRVFFED